MILVRENQFLNTETVFITCVALANKQMVIHNLGPDVPDAEIRHTSQESSDASCQSEESSRSHDTRDSQSDQWVKPDVQFAAKDFKLGVKLKKDLSESQEDDVVKVVRLPDGTKQLFFRFDKLKGNSDSPTLETLYEEVRSVLQKRTNFDQLPNQNTYLTVLVKLLQAAYFGRSVDPQTQVVFQALADELEFISEPDKEESVSDEEDSEPENTEEDNLDEAHGSSSSGEIHIIEGEEEYQFKVLSTKGVGVQIKTKMVKPVFDAGQDETNIPAYADQSDFEETGDYVHIHRSGKEQKLIDKNIHSSAITGETQINQGHKTGEHSTIPGIKIQIIGNDGNVLKDVTDTLHERQKYTENENLDFSELEDNANPDLVEGLKQVIKKSEASSSEQQTGSQTQEKESDSGKTSHSQDAQEYKQQPKFERTVRSLKQNPDEKNSRN